jgi:Fur family ferric uptake transcriptional regulator
MNRETALFRELLKKHGYSLTRPRQELFQVLQTHNACTMHELTSLLHQFDRATVYRTTSLFEKLGIIHRLHIGWKYKLELSDIFHHHHHHLTCSNCGRITILKEDTVIEKRIISLSQYVNFTPTDHQLEIRGLCQACGANGITMAGLNNRSLLSTST